jgi:arsenical-resistance protein 2
MSSVDPPHIEPKTSTPQVYISKEAVREKILNNDSDYIIIDLRRMDFEGGSIRGALNLPAQSIHSSIRTMATMCKLSHKPNIFIHCGSSQNRARRGWGYFQDLIEAEPEEFGMLKPQVLQGGIKGWAKRGSDYTSLMDNYDQSKW